MEQVATAAFGDPPEVVRAVRVEVFFETHCRRGQVGHREAVADAGPEAARGRGQVAAGQDDRQVAYRRSGQHGGERRLEIGQRRGLRGPG